MLPVVTMKAKFSHPVISPWFQERSETKIETYPNGKTLYIAEPNGTGKIFYPNGKVAVIVEKGGVDELRTRVWVKGSGEVAKDGIKDPPQVVAVFDSLGNGIVYDRCLRKRLVYNQKEGAFLNTPQGIPVYWTWHDLGYTGSMSIMNEEDSETSLISTPPNIILLTDPLERAKPPSDKGTELVKSNQTSSQTEVATKLTKSEIQFREHHKRHWYLNTEKLMPKRVSPVKPICLQINRYIALRILSQSEINLSFFALTKHTCLRIGVLYNPVDKLKVVEIEEGTAFRERVLCPYESFPPDTKTMLKFRLLINKIRSKSWKKKSTTSF